MLLMVAEPSSARLTRKSGTSFYYAFLLLPKAKRHAIFALYSFCRVVDDCVDEEGGGGERGLESWLEEIRRSYSGTPQTPLGSDLQQALRLFPIPLSSFEAIVAGCRMDLVPTPYPTFAELEVYCRRVASAVGLAAIEIFGYRDPRTRDYADALGIALQLTNILRDVGADARRGRLYLPLEDLERFAVEEGGLLAYARGGGPGPPPGLQPLLSFAADRALRHHEGAKALLPAEDRRAMLSAEVMRVTYRALLDEIVRRGFPLFGPKTRVSRPRAAGLALLTLLRSWLP
jgi:phytoene synthase